MIKPIFFVYFPGAGGKALINCLHLCDGVVLNDLSWRGDRLQRVLATVPERKDHASWFDHEIHNAVKGCDAVTSDPKSTPVPDCLRHVDGFLPLVAHWSHNLHCYQEQLGKGHVIKLMPNLDWLDLALRLKWHEFTEDEPGFNSRAWQLWLDDTNNVRADYTIYDYNPLSSNFERIVQEILCRFNLQSNSEAIKCYIDRYLYFHVDQT